MKRIFSVLTILAFALGGLLFAAPAEAASSFAVTNRTGHTFSTSKGTIANNKSRDGFTESSTFTTGSYRFKFQAAGDGHDISACFPKKTSYRFGKFDAGLYSWVVAVPC